MNSLVILLFFLLGACKPFQQIDLKINKSVTIADTYPQYVNAHGGDVVTFTGGALNKVKAIHVNGENCSSLNHISDAQISCMPASNNGIASLADVTFITEQGTVTMPDALTYTLILGQANSTSFGFIDRAFSTPLFSQVMANKFFISDSSNHRILIWHSVPTSFLTPPDLVLGQPNGRSRTVAGSLPSGSSLSTPIGAWTDGTKLAVADYGNNRVLLWHSFPTVSGQAPDVVLGQPDLLTTTLNNGPNTVPCGGVAGLNACSLNRPYHVIFEEDKLIVSDSSNHRLMIWDNWPSVNQEPADHVIGQPSFIVNTSNNGPASAPCGAAGRNACSFHTPNLFTYHDGKLIVPDTGNNRVLIFNSIPVAYGSAADLVLGQAGFTTNTTSGPATVPCGGVAGINACSLSGPKSVTTDGISLYIADYINNRVLGWSTFPTVNQQPADIVLGQSSFLTNAVNDGASSPTAASLNQPAYVNLNDNKLWLADRSNNRVLRFSPLPASFASAGLVIGHSNFTDSTLNVLRNTSDELQFPAEAKFDGTHFFIVDRYNHRVIIESGLPTSLSIIMSRVTLGQPDAVQGSYHNGPNTVACGGVAGLNACSLKEPMAVLKVGTKLVVADFGNNRVLIWNTIPTSDQTPADLVLGQPGFITNTANNGPNTVPCGGSLGKNRCSLQGPIGLESDGTNLIVNDFSSNRILIWNTFPTVTQQPADIVLGQPDFISGTINNGPNNASCDNSAGLNRCSFSAPFNLKIYNGKLVVVDQKNHRVLIWNTVPTVDQAPADVVIGHEDFITGTILSPPNGKSLYDPRGLCITSSGRLVISDTGNNRLLVFNQIPTSNNAEADVILGQDNESGQTMDGGKTINAGNFNYQYGLGCYQENVIVSDYQNSRIQYFPLKPVEP